MVQVMNSADVAAAGGALRHDIVLNSFRGLRSDGVVPSVMSSPPTVTVGANSGSPVITPYSELAMTSAKLTWRGGPATRLDGSSPFYSPRRTGGSVRFCLGAASRFEFRAKRFGPKGYSIMIDGQKAFASGWGVAPGTGGLRVNGDQYVLVDVGANTTSHGLADVQIAGGGSGHAVGDVVPIAGGTSTTTASIRVTAVSSGVITGLEFAEPGVYSVKPSNPVAQGTSSGSGTGATFVVIWAQTQSTTKTRKVEIFCDAQAWLGGIVASSPRASVAPIAVPAHAPRLAVVTDSFGAGGFVADIVDGYPIRLGQRLGLSDALLPDGVSGSGYTAVNSRPALSARVADIAALAPDAIVIALGLNDYLAGVNTSAVQAAVTANIDALHVALPGALIVVLTPWYATSGYVNAIKNGVAAATDQNRARAIDLDAAGIYLAGSTNLGVVSSDSVHPSGAQGHAYLADMTAPLIASALAEMAGQVMGY